MVRDKPPAPEPRPISAERFRTLIATAPEVDAEFAGELRAASAGMTRPSATRNARAFSRVRGLRVISLDR